MRHAHWTLASAAAALLLVGCTASDAPRDYGRGPLVVERSTLDDALFAARDVLSQEFPRLRVDRAKGVVAAEPVEFVTTRESGSARDLVGGKTRMRRSAVLTVAERDGATRVWLRVDVERLDTQRQAATLAAAGRVSDSPAYTPIQVDAATTPEQNDLWTHVRRDRAMERALLDEINERLTPETERDAAPDSTSPAENAAQ